MVGQTYSARKLRPDRDLSDIGEALSAYQQLVNLYPNSRYVSEAQTRMEDLRELLAEHEWLVGEFYLRNKRYQGALGRFEFIRENYPDFSKIETVNVKISELETIIAERDAEWKRHIEALEKSSED
jgi:outer membrane protein assembly factor BamD